MATKQNRLTSTTSLEPMRLITCGSLVEALRKEHLRFGVYVYRNPKKYFMVIFKNNISMLYMYINKFGHLGYWEQTKREKKKEKKVFKYPKGLLHNTIY